MGRGPRKGRANEKEGGNLVQNNIIRENACIVDLETSETSENCPTRGMRRRDSKKTERICQVAKGPAICQRP